MWNKPLPETMRRIPQLYSTENIPLNQKTIYLHMFLFGSDWFIAEWDGFDLMFGFVVINEDYTNSEWGLISLSELDAINIDGIEIDNDIFWTPCPASEVRTICKAHGWPYPRPAKHTVELSV